MKRIYLQPERRNDEEAINARILYSNNFMNFLVTHSHNKIIFFDEVGFSLSMRCRKGRSNVGERAIHTVGNIRSRNVSMFCSINN